VRSFIWSSGSDGFIREWTLGGPERQCVRQIAPEGFDKGAYAVVPLGYDVWTCGHHPNIQVFSQADFFKTAEHPAHEPYVSNLLTVDRVETKIVWSTSIGDKKLKVWRHTIRGEVPSIDELKAANRLFEEEEEVRAKRLEDIAKRSSMLEDQLSVSAEEYRNQLEALATDLASSKARAEELDARCKTLEEELEGLRKLFEDLGLGKLMEDPDALAAFLRRALSFEKIFKDLGLEHFLENPEELRRVLEAFADLGLEHLLHNPEELKQFLSSAKQLKEMLEAAGFGDVFNDPSKLEELKQSLDLLKQVRELFEQHGLGDAFKDPALLAEILSRYEGLRKAFEEFGFSDLFEDPYNLKGFLRNYAKLRDAFRELGLEYLLDSAAAMRDFLKGHTSGEKELLDLRAKASRLEEVEEKLRRRDEELARAKEEAKSLRERLAAYEAVGDLESFKRWKSEAAELRALMRAKGNADSELAELRRILEEKERERQEALERERLMAIKYKELDIFKLDIIARELKALDNELGMVGKEAKFLQHSAGRLKEFGEQQQIHQHGCKMLDQCVQLRAHIRDVINKCLSETQKLHIGAAIDDHLAAGELKDGGVMAGFVCEEVEASVHGSSKAARLRQADEMNRERRMQSRPGTGRQPG